MKGLKNILSEDLSNRFSDGIIDSSIILSYGRYSTANSVCRNEVSVLDNGIHSIIRPASQYPMEILTYEEYR
jgi:hypothetical protein